MASSTVAASLPQTLLGMNNRELDAAQALLGAGGGSDNNYLSAEAHSSPRANLAPRATTSAVSSASSSAEDQPTTTTITRRPRSDSAGLDALAALASQERSSPTHSLVPSSSSSSSCSEDDAAMPPPSPRRPRSASNPEGMEKWDSLLQPKEPRRHFVLPASILEVELAKASEAVKEQRNNNNKRPESIPEETPEDEVGKQEDNVDDSNLTPEELLRRARSRLLEDLSEGNVNGEKGVLTLPHSLAKYKEVYNRNGRIGIYTPAERAAIIDRFKGKRSRRVWNKKIRYGCRKNLADRRLRVKGRFVKRSEQEQLAKKLRQAEKAEKQKMKKQADQDMPDVNDPDAGFAPTEDQPYRRLRRHTIT